MTFRQRNMRYRMPLVFGPTAGPRQGPEGERFDCSNAPKTVAGVSFLTDSAALKQLLPPHCEIDGEPVITVEHAHLREVEWLAGRGYAMLGVKFPVCYQSMSERVRGPFLSVLWENRAEPILSGREELGFAKLYCELPQPRILHGTYHYSAIWEGHEFVKLSLDNLTEAAAPEAENGDGTLHHYYLPRIGAPGETEVERMVISPAHSGVAKYLSFYRGTGSVTFAHSTWEQLPTMFHIVNALADLPILECLGGWLAETRGTTDLDDQRVLR